MQSPSRPRPVAFIQPSRTPHASLPPMAPVHYRPPSETSSGSSRNPSLSSTESRGMRGDPFGARRGAGRAWEHELRTPKESWTSEPAVAGRDDVESQFDNLLEQLQVPTSVREKFSTVGRDVKTSLLLSNLSNPSVLSALTPPPAGPATPRVKKRLSTPLLRKAKSSSSIGSPGAPSPQVGTTYRVDGDSFTIVASPDPARGMERPSAPPAHARGRSIDVGRPRASRPAGARPSRPNSFFGPAMPKKGLGITVPQGPEDMVRWLASGKATSLAMEVGTAKKLRMLLRHESTDWVAAFIDMGGYELVLDRLQDLLDVEWREEQHDDQMLYELLRCIKALSTSEVGKSALRASSPRPFEALSKLLFSEKKPGDLASRQIIVELWLVLFDLFPSRPAHSPATMGEPSRVRHSTHGPPRPQPPTPRRAQTADMPPPSPSVRFGAAGAAPSAQEEVDVAQLVRALLVPDQDDPAKDHHAFVTAAHRPRVFKAWVQELSDICRDYFWIMCHATNTLWALDEVDETAVERPVAPGGATGGVEFEAMAYVTTHFRLLNALAKTLANQDVDHARRLHDDLMLSGMDRILVTMRKASTTYYPTLHLELARYVRLLQLASPGARLPYLIDKLVGPPPEHARRRGRQPSYLPPMPISTDGGRRGGFDMQL
ncbi:hypothetical protein Q5752_003289 [Cryptotrichosporon argae]